MSGGTNELFEKIIFYSLREYTRKAFKDLETVRKGLILQNCKFTTDAGKKVLAFLKVENIRAKKEKIKDLNKLDWADYNNRSNAIGRNVYIRDSFYDLLEYARNYYSNGSLYPLFTMRPKHLAINRLNSLQETVAGYHLNQLVDDDNKKFEL